MSSCACCKGKICKYVIVFRVYIANSYDLDINEYYDGNKCSHNYPYDASVDCECKDSLYQYSFDSSLVGCGVIRPIPNPNAFTMPDISCVAEDKKDKLHFTYDLESYTYPAPKIQFLEMYINSKLEATDDFTYIAQQGQKFKTYKRNNCAYSNLLTSKIKYDYYRGNHSTLNAKIINPKTGTDTNPDFKIKGFNYASIGDLGYMFLNSKEKFKANIKFLNNDGTVYSTVNPPAADPLLCNSENNLSNIKFDYIKGTYVIENQIEADLNLLDTSEDQNQKIFIYPIIVTYAGGKYAPTGNGGGTLHLQSKLLVGSSGDGGTSGNELVNPLVVSVDKIKSFFEVNSSLEVSDSLKYCGQSANALTPHQLYKYDCASHSIVGEYFCGRSDVNKIVPLGGGLSVSPSFKHSLAIKYSFYDPITNIVASTKIVPIVPLTSTLKMNDYFFNIGAFCTVQKTQIDGEKVDIIISELYEVCENKIDITNDKGEIPVSAITSNNSYSISTTSSSLLAIPAGDVILTSCTPNGFTTSHDNPPPNTIGMYYDISCSFKGMIAGLAITPCNGIPTYDYTKRYAESPMFGITYSLFYAYPDGIPPVNSFEGSYYAELLIDGQNYGSDFSISDGGLNAYTLGVLYS
jgi:hypothetical protein